jgi:hypothetical protein
MLIRRTLALAVAGLTLLGLAASTGRAAEPDAKLMPGDAEFVLVADYQKIVNSAMFKKYGMEPFKTQLQDPQVKQALEGVGLDPLKDIDTLVVTNSGKFDETGNLFIGVKGRFDLDKIDAAAKKADLKVHKDGNRTIYETTGGNPAFITFLDKNTMAMSSKKDYLVDVVGGKVKPGKNAGELKNALGKANKGDSIVVAVVLTEEMKQALKGNPQMAALAPKLNSITASVNVTDAAQIDVLINCADQATANQVSMQIKQLLPLMKVLLQGQQGVPPVVGDVIDKIKTGTNGNSVTISLKITDEIIQKAIQQAGGKGGDK